MTEAPVRAVTGAGAGDRLEEVEGIHPVAYGSLL